MKVEWWYDDAHFHDSGGSELRLARLTLRDDGSAAVLTGDLEEVEFETNQEAGVWLADEEYRRLEDLLQDREQESLPPDPRIQLPTASADDELRRQMIIRLNGVADPLATKRESR